MLIEDLCYNSNELHSKCSTYVRMIFSFFINIVNEFFTYPGNVTRLKLFFSFFTHDQIFLKVFFHYFFTVFILLKNCFNKFKGNIFTSKNKYWLSKFIINTNKFVPFSNLTDCAPLMLKQTFYVLSTHFYY